MRAQGIGIFILAAALIVIPVSAFGHHPPTMYDMTRSVSVKGTVTSFDWANPHSLIYLEAKDEKGNVQKGIAETGSPSRLTRAGWNKDSLKPGDEITLVGHPAKDGTYAMRLEKVVLASGKELTPHSYSIF